MIDPDTLLIGVAAHSTREGMAHKLVKRVRAQVVNIDHTMAREQCDAFAACAANHMTVLSRLHSLATIRNPWVIVLEDDALPIEDFREHAAAALFCAESPVVGFYISRAGAGLNLPSLRPAFEAGTAWAVSNHLVSAVAYAIRADELASVIDRWGDEPADATVERRMTNWAISRRSEVFGEPRFYYTMPSLVDHAPVDSIIFDEANSWMRRAWKLGAAADWDTPAVEYDPI